jgi:hypothetical protein
MTQHNLGNAYFELPTGDRSENLRRAIACYENALRVYTETEFPYNWAMHAAQSGDCLFPAADGGSEREPAQGDSMLRERPAGLH